MFKHVLLPTDGSPLSEAAIERGVQFARSVGARVTGLFVMPPFHFFTYQPEMLEDTEDEFEAHCKEHAAAFLAVIERAAKAAGVECEVATATSDHPYEEIIKAAESRGCDLIMMASHGRKGMQALILGSETHKVLTHSKIPVLVYR